ncbi:hypothetical protein XELAEV_18003715mg [Xenopus laevis]|uniref:Uncharacterized protein n=1 Tax=Xenopus laevis TaxID=8355 RepID=A0A974BN82_XENLA|nr:hypothetical protein XELAEV_18003715mg [Xenopus laevis]
MMPCGRYNLESDHLCWYSKKKVYYGGENAVISSEMVTLHKAVQSGNNTHCYPIWLTNKNSCKCMLQ